MIRNIHITAQPGDAGKRLDQFVFEKIPSSTRPLIRTAVTHGGILKNNHPAAKGSRIASGDTIAILLLQEQCDRCVLPNPDLPLHIVFEDEALLVLNKPPGMPVHPLRIEESGTLANAMIARYPALAEVGGDPLFPALAHRIDTDTSGLVVAARTNEAYTSLRRQFQERRVLKEYIALVRGTPPPHGKLEHYLTHNPARRGQMLASHEAPTRKKLRPMHAVTEFGHEKVFSEYTLLRVVIRTGVTHQIRCQLAAAGYPIAGDMLYGGNDAENEMGLSRHFLHATALAFEHPLRKETVRFEAPLPDDLQQALKKSDGRAV